MDSRIESAPEKFHMLTNKMALPGLVPDSDGDHRPAGVFSHTRGQPSSGVQTATVKANQWRLALIRIGQESTGARKLGVVCDQLDVPKVTA
jgi:hypothetical protein